MNIKEKRARAIKKINELIKVMDDSMYEKREYNGQVYNIAYIGMEGYLSYQIKQGNKIYLFVKEDLTEKQREEEFIYAAKNKLRVQSKEELEELNNLALKDFKYKNVNYDDVDNILKNMHLDDIIEALKFKNEVGEIINNGLNVPSIGVLITTIFNLGVIQGKREIRQRKAKAVRGGKYYV